MSIRSKLLILALGGVFLLFLLELFYASSEQYILVVVVFGLIVIASTAAALMLTRGIISRLRNLNSVVRQFGDGDYTVQAKVSGSDEIAQLMVSFNNMTEKVRERRHRFEEVDRLKSEFVSSVSHELRTPLTTIKALTRLLMREDLAEEKRSEYLDTISVECDRQIDLVLNLLDLSRIEGGVYSLFPERVDVLDVINSCVKSELRAAEKRHHKLKIEPFEEVPPVCADAKALRRVLSNLIENSIKYTADGGLILLTAKEENGFVCLSVMDNGRGIPPEDLPVLFNKFHRGRPTRNSAAGSIDDTEADFLEDADVSGVGLGLYLGKNVMEQMGGRITVDTEVGIGSTFTLHLPVWIETDCGIKSEKEKSENG